MRLAIRKKRHVALDNSKEPAQSFTILLPTAETYRHRAEEAKRLAMQSRDVWEREILLRVATQWQLLAAHRELKESNQRLTTIEQLADGTTWCAPSAMKKNRATPLRSPYARIRPNNK